MPCEIIMFILYTLTLIYINIVTMFIFRKYLTIYLAAVQITHTLIIYRTKSQQSDK